MPTNTEFFIVPLKPGADISDSSKEAAASFQECAKYITQADGFQEMYFGQWVEKPEMLQVLVSTYHLQKKNWKEGMFRRSCFNCRRRVFSCTTRQLRGECSGRVAATDAPFIETQEC